ncbi:unnamed protein product, partial [marine sediment metagenome]
MSDGKKRLAHGAKVSGSSKSKVLHTLSKSSSFGGQLDLKKGDRVHVIDYGGVISVVPVSRAPIKRAMG